MIPLKQALDGLSAFATQDVITAMPNGVSKFLALMAVGSMRNNSANFVKPYEKMLVSFGIMNEAGDMIDETVLRSALEEAFGSMPSVTWMGFTFDAQDAEKLLRRIGA